MIGGNGSGKSSLLRIMAGEDDGFTGEARLTPGFTVGHLAQEPDLDPTKDVLGNISDGVGEAKAMVDRYNEVCAAFGEPDADFDKLLAEQAELQDKIDAAGAWDLERTFEIAMDALRCPPGDADVSTLSGGERRRVALCRLLLSKPDLLLLDEPTNHLDAESVAWLERTLQEYPGTVVAVTHDRYFLDNVAGWILELDRGGGIPWEGNYSSWLEQKQDRLAREQRADTSPPGGAAARARVDPDVAPGPPVQGQGPDQRLQRPRGRGRSRREAGRQTRDHDPRRTPPRRPGHRRRGRDEGVRRPAAHRRPLVPAAPGRDRRGHRTERRRQDDPLPDDGRRGDTRRRDPGRGHDGGAGLCRPVPGRARPGSHRVRGDHRRGRPHGGRGREIHGRAYVASFGFTGSDQQKKVGQLSGGERNRVQLAKVLKSGGNVLLLDEPTNDLDVDTLRALEEALLGFPGCAVVISHDRWFLDRISTHVLAFEGDSEVRWFEGNFSDYEADRHKRLGVDADQPHRIRYKPLVRD